jgi:recX family
MTITEILPLGTKKSKVLTDEDFAFSLYRGEVKKMELEVGRELTDDFLKTELYPLLIRRSRERLLYLLKQRDYTEEELRRKFREGFYPEEIAELALDYGRSLRYVDDRRVAETYIRTRSGEKSARYLKTALLNRGFDKELIEELLEAEAPDEGAQICRELKKRGYSPELDAKAEQRIYAALLRKGYTYGAIRDAIRTYTCDNS